MTRVDGAAAAENPRALARGGSRLIGRSPRFWLIVAISLLALALLPAADAAAQSEAPDAYGEVPLSFAPNVGQTDERARYVAQGAGYSFFFADAEAMLSFAPAADDVAGSSGLALGLRFLGADPEARLETDAPAAGTVTRLTGSDEQPSAVPTYEELIYRELWPKIDLAVHGQGGELRYEFHLRPGADPRDIRLAYAGADRLAVGSSGDLAVDTPLGELTDTRPVAHQEIDGRRMSLDSRHVLLGPARTEIGHSHP